MYKVKRNERIGVILDTLYQTPNKLHRLDEFANKFGSAKSTISEDIDILQNSMENYHIGEISTIAGAAGGVRYRATVGPEEANDFLEYLSERLSEPGRLLPGGFLYTSDITADPVSATMLGRLLAQIYYDTNPDVVLTMETKGIPVALMTARMLGVPLIIARRDSRAYEGSAVKINYIGSGDKIGTMALAKRSVEPGQRALIIDDFMKGGGTLRGMFDLMQEFDVDVVGIGVMITTEVPREKRVSGARSLLIMRNNDARKGVADVRPLEIYK